MKTYLKTQTCELTIHQIREVVFETISWCETNFGKKSYKVDYSVRTLGDKYSPCCGCYDSSTRTIKIFRNYTPDIKSVVKVVLHEYTHYLQNLRWYNNVLGKVGYDNHPQEIDARNMENMYSICWKQIKNKI
jgi:hypothetical protein